MAWNRLGRGLRDVWDNPMMKTHLQNFGEEVAEGYRQGLGKSIFSPRGVDYSGMTPRAVLANEIGGVAGDFMSQATRAQYWRYNHPLAILDEGVQRMGRAAGLGPTASRSLTGVAVAAPFLLNDRAGKGVHFPEREWDTEQGKYVTSDPTQSRAPVRETMINAIGWSGPTLPYPQFSEEVPGVSEERYKQYKLDMNRKGGGKFGYWLGDNLGPVAAAAAAAGALLGGVGMAKQAGRLGDEAIAAVRAAQKVGLDPKEFSEAIQNAAKTERAAQVAAGQIGRQAVVGAVGGAGAAALTDTALATGLVRFYDKPVGDGREVPTMRFAGFEAPLPGTAAIVGSTAAVLAGPSILSRVRQMRAAADAKQAVRGFTQAVPSPSAAPPPPTPFDNFPDLPY